MHETALPDHVEDGKLTYGDYLKIPELLALQSPQSNPAHPDELLFIVIHQAYELWFKLILNELENAIRLMNDGEALRAHHFVNRSVEVMKLLVMQIHLLETMRPVEFLEFRDRLMPASGFQSRQFREVEFICGMKDESIFRYFQSRPEMATALKKRLAEGDVKEAFYALLGKLGFKIPKDAASLERKNDEPAIAQVLDVLRSIYQDPEKNLPLYMLTEGLLELDEQLGYWRSHHAVVVERVIGRKRGTGGSSGVDYLRSTLGKRIFPLLWEARTLLTKRIT